MNRSVAFKTLGCRLNQSETDSLVSDFHQAGYIIVEFSDTADVYVINTCTVTNQSDKKSRNLIHQISGRNKNALVIVTGCMVNNYKDILKDIPRSFYYIENNLKSSILSMVEAHFMGNIIFPEKFKPGVFNYSAAATSFHTRSMIKIQDGCDHYCTFCIVPLVRGKAISRPTDDIIDNIRKVTDSGFREIVITGVNIGLYKCDDTDFDDLIEKILTVPGNFRVRVSSIEPDGFSDKLIRLFNHPKLMPHLHLCLQSGSDHILMQMRRTYKLSPYLNIVEQLKKSVPLFNFTTDIMVGFPGETEQDFEDTCKVIREVGFSHVHTFKYSIRQGTRAAQMSNQVTEKTKQQRSLIMREIASANKQQYRQLFVGKQQTVLVEKVNKNGIAKGYGQHYVPVEFKSSLQHNNFFSTITIKSMAGASHDFILKGEVG